MGGHVAQKLSRDSKNISIGEAVLVPPMNCPDEILEVQPQQDVIAASSSDYSNSEDEYTHIEEEPTPVSGDGRLSRISFAYFSSINDYHFYLLPVGGTSLMHYVTDIYYYNLVLGPLNQFFIAIFYHTPTKYIFNT